ncbi:MAG TPA: UbiA family prenyltransferase, partial [Solirubrobacterales bacterium]|nr:UbiA family prenyltransferase [Solirubrobacterales bacterium]
METITSEQPTVPAEPNQSHEPETGEVVPRRSPLRAAIKTGRPKEWIKNVFVFAGLLFSGKFDQSHAVVEATITFVAFCLVSSAGYFLNDLVDVELDRKHPKKRFRPLAAGELSEAAAKAIAPVVAVIGVGIGFL